MSTNNSNIKTVYVHTFFYPYLLLRYGRKLPHIHGIQSTMNKPDIPDPLDKDAWELNNNRLVDKFDIDTTNMTEDEYNKILICHEFSEDNCMEKMESWREWIKRYEICN